MQNNTSETIIAMGMVSVLLVITTALAVNLRDIIQYFQTRVELRREKNARLQELNAQRKENAEQIAV